MWRSISLGALLLAFPVQAADCTLTDARYKQPDAPWWLTFKRVPQFAAPNQTAAFYLELPNSGVEMQGGVSIPNGFGSPLWSLEGPCTPPELAEEGAPVEFCSFLDDSQYPAIYGEYDGKVKFLDTDAGAAVPEQVILPNLAASLWYSNYRQTEWLDGADIGDAFTLVGCD